MLVFAWVSIMLVFTQVPVLLICMGIRLAVAGICAGVCLAVMLAFVRAFVVLPFALASVMHAGVVYLSCVVGTHVTIRTTVKSIVSN